MAKFPQVSKFALNITLLHLAFWDKYIDPHPLPFILKKPCFPQSFKRQNNATKGILAFQDSPAHWSSNGHHEHHKL